MTTTYTVMWQDEYGWMVALVNDLLFANGEFDQSQVYGPYDTQAEALAAVTPTEHSRTI